MTVLQFPQYSTSAAKSWAKIPGQWKQERLANVYYLICWRSVEIVNYSGIIKGDDLLLAGVCANCGNAVARLVEGFCNRNTSTVMSTVRG